MFEQKYDLLFLAHQTTTIFAWILFHLHIRECKLSQVNSEHDSKTLVTFCFAFCRRQRERERKWNFASKNQVTHLGTCHLNIFAEHIFNFLMWQYMSGMESVLNYFFYIKLLSDTTHSVLKLDRWGSPTDGLLMYVCVSYVKRFLFATQESDASKKQPLSRTQFFVFTRWLCWSFQHLITTAPYLP